jgi:hypothetical protein
MKSSLPSAFFVLAAPLCSQIGSVPGTDIRAYDVLAPTVAGRQGPAYPNGEAGVIIGHGHCNSGTVHLPWVGWVGGTSSGVMLDTYPKIAFLLARESNGRMVQVSGKSYLKHSRVAFNFSSGPCAPCQSGPAQTFRVGCSDAYSTGFNGNQYNLGPTDEIDPWLGSWNPVGSYFDRGDPAVVGPTANDGIQSLTATGFGPVKNRMVVPETELSVPGTFYGQVHLMIKGEPVGNRANNLRSSAMTFTWNGGFWSAALAGPGVEGSVLTRWTGASFDLGGNGMDDGRFLVAVKVTGPSNGLWHYEYAVHNLDNARGGASLRIPVCPTARVLNTGFRDIDRDPLNQWTMSRSGGEIAFLASANNALDWNCIYNFWFDSDAAPVAGTVSLDEARLGPGALTVAVGSQVPGLLGTEHLGDGCGTPAPAAFPNGVPASPNPAYAIQFQLAPSAFLVAALALAPANVPLGSGCTVFVDGSQLALSLLVQANASGAASVGLAIPPGLSPLDIYCQGFELVPAGPVLGFLAASNGLRIRAGGTGCP